MLTILGSYFEALPSGVSCSGDGCTSLVFCCSWTDLAWGAKGSDGVIKIKPPHSIVRFNHKPAESGFSLGCLLHMFGDVFCPRGEDKKLGEREA